MRGSLSIKIDSSSLISVALKIVEARSGPRHSLRDTELGSVRNLNRFAVFDISKLQLNLYSIVIDQLPNSTSCNGPWSFYQAIGYFCSSKCAILTQNYRSDKVTLRAR